MFAKHYLMSVSAMLVNTVVFAILDEHLVHTTIPDNHLYHNRFVDMIVIPGNVSTNRILYTLQFALVDAAPHKVGISLQ